MKRNENEKLQFDKKSPRSRPTQLTENLFHKKLFCMQREIK